jgi:ubiquinone/menaquinone biosynthesis C-methylase UbiE
MDKDRWASVWHQLDEVTRFKPQRVLEIGPGPGLMKRAGAAFDVAVETLDLDRDLEPDHLGSVLALPFADGSFDVVCAFQMLEHLPYVQSLQAFAQMARVASKAVVISLPDLRPMWRYSLYLPCMGQKRWLVNRPFWKPQPHRFDGEHYWEINKTETPLDKVIADLSALMPMQRTYRMFDEPYYRFFIFAP